METEFIQRPAAEQAALLTQYLPDAPPRQPGESDAAYINRTIAALAESEADDLLTNLTILQQANILSERTSTPAATIIEDTATALFGKLFTECDTRLRRAIQSTLQRKLILSKSTT